MTDTDIGTLEQEIKQVRARLARVEGERDELLAALEKAAEVFDFYAKHHATKTIPEDDKARKNYKHRNMCRTAIARVKDSQ